MRAAVIQPAPITLTRQQRRVLALAASGMDLYEIAAELWLSYETVRWHLKSCHRRLGVHTRNAAILRALELGLLTSDRTKP